jgi:DNA-binding NarL/FixJ family response regulator
MASTRILLADDHPDLLKALRDLVSELGEVVGTVTDGQALVQAAQRLNPDVIFTDISMPKMDGLEATRVICAQVPGSRVIILSSFQEPAYVTLAFEAGACGYILKKTALRAELAQALLHVLAGDRYVGLGVRGERELGDSAALSEFDRSERPAMQSGGLAS